MKKMTAKEVKLKKEEFLNTYLEIRTLQATLIKTEISRSSYYHWMKSDSQFKEEKSQVEELIASSVEERLFLLIDEEHFPSIKFFLENKHQDYKKDKGEDENLSVKASYPVIRFVQAKEKYQKDKKKK
jgi:hypothetical protein